MKTLLLIALLLAGMGIGYPLVNEETSNACSALERRLISALSARERSSSAALVLSSLQSSFSNGAFIRPMVKQRNPAVPPVLTCGLAYWRVFLDPNQAEIMIDELLTRWRTAAEELIGTIDPKAAAAAEAQKAMRALATPAPAAAPKADQPGAGSGDGHCYIKKYDGSVHPCDPVPGTAAIPKTELVPAPSYRPSDQRALDRVIGTQR